MKKDKLYTYENRYHGTKLKRLTVLGLLLCCIVGLITGFIMFVTGNETTTIFVVWLWCIFGTLAGIFNVNREWTKKRVRLPIDTTVYKQETDVDKLMKGNLK